MSSAACQRQLIQTSGVYIPGAGHHFTVNLTQASATQMKDIMMFNWRADPCAVDTEGSGFYPYMYYKGGCIPPLLVWLLSLFGLDKSNSF